MPLQSTAILIYLVLTRKGNVSIDNKTEANSGIPLCLVLASLPHRLFQPCPTREKKHEKTDEGQISGVHVQATKGDLERLPQSEDDCLRMPIHLVIVHPMFHQTRTMLRMKDVAGEV